MIYPIVAYGNPVLRKVAAPVSKDFPELGKLIEDMWETMYASNGVGLAAPQIDKSIRLFVIDTAQMFANMEDDEMANYPDNPGEKLVFINAQIQSLNGDAWLYNEGCLSLPKIREDISREKSVTMEFMNENFETQTKTFTGLTARVILHEYDHIEGKLFIDHISAFKRKLMRGKLNDISKGKIDVDYKMSFPG
ncbi:MAG: peptide deformylase [Chitinophagaceae bacterium]|nr:peptide deformylase [Chitinophagaceae bacterium]MCB0739685.1 peptide deformylase [Chitinophagaceae bacterium]HQU56093.1 peptide deformylase [Chitinophagaceae bacterium]HQV06103.1 peptide deformylase [Chitinophagaceae bacterium]